MPVPDLAPPMTAEEYLEGERHSPVKHEYVAGEVFAMAGATDAHVTITTNMVAMLWAHLRGNPCRAYVADMKVRVATEDVFYYPDVFVTCDERDRSKVLFKEYPVLIIEVLSESTSAFDRGTKFAHYRRLESLQEYVLIDTERASVECFRRADGGRWILQPYGPGEEIELESLGFRCSMDAVYEKAAVG